MEKNPENLFCKKCSLQFNEEAVYDMHLSSGHEITIQQAVDDLNFKLSKNKQENSRYMPRTNHAKENADLFCEKCSEQFDEKAVYDIHNLIEHKDIIQQAFDVKKQEGNTLKPRTNNAKSTEVPLEQTTQPKRKDKYIASIHEGKKLYKCILCDNNFIYRISLREHICSVLEKDKP